MAIESQRSDNQPSKLSMAIQLVRWTFKFLEYLGVNLVLKHNGAYLTFEHVDFADTPQEPSNTHYYTADVIINFMEQMNQYVEETEKLGV